MWYYAWERFSSKTKLWLLLLLLLLFLLFRSRFAVVSVRGWPGLPDKRYSSITGSRWMERSIVQSDDPFLFLTIFSSPVITWQSGRVHRRAFAPCKDEARPLLYLFARQQHIHTHAHTYTVISHKLTKLRFVTNKGDMGHLRLSVRCRLDRLLLRDALVLICYFRLLELKLWLTLAWCVCV